MSSPSTTTPTQKETKMCCEKTLNLLQWKNPIETGKVMGLILLCLIFVKKIQITFILKVFYTIVLTFSAVEFVSMKLLNKSSSSSSGGLITKYLKPKQCYLAAFISGLKPKVENFIDQLCMIQNEIFKIIFVVDPIKSGKIGIFCYILSILFKIISFYKMMYVLLILTFTIPLIYKKNQKKIDSLIDSNMELLNEHSSKIMNNLEKSPLGSYLPKKTGSTTTTSTTTTTTPSTTSKVEELNEKIEATTTSFEK